LIEEKIKEEIEWFERAERKKHSEAHLFAHNQVKKILIPLLQKLEAQNKKILIAGIGSGAEVPSVSKISKNLIGFDIAFDSLKQCSDIFQIPLAVANCNAIPFKYQSFDIVLAIGLLHHLTGQGKLIDYLIQKHKTLRKGGYLIALEPNLFHPSGLAMTICQKIKPGILGLVPHEVALSPLGLKLKFKKAGFSDIKIEAASYVYNRFPLWVSKFIVKYEDKIRRKWPFKFFGWFTLIYGRT
jgi:hypothetical protein